MPYPVPAPWNHTFVACRDAWALLPPKGRDRVDWGAVRVAHLDTGYTFHPAFGFEREKTYRPGDTSAIIVKDGGDFYAPERKTAFDPLDPFELIEDVELQPRGHGTFSGSMLAGLEPAKEFYGVAPGLPLVSLRITDGSVLIGRRAVACADAINTVVRDGLAPIINISVGTPFEHPRIRAALNRAYEAGVIVVCAGGQIIGQVVYPAAYAKAISVGGVRRIKVVGAQQNRIYMHYGKNALIDVWAPAASLRRGHVEPSGTQSGPYSTGYFEGADGTTYAATHVTAAAAMWLRLRGAEIDAKYGRGWRRIEAFRKLVRDRQLNVPRISDAERNKLGRLFGKTACLNIHRLIQAKLPEVRDDDEAGIQR